jgi:S-DNA-T family DNA segregation ATPase FtsK/SpoIIIE
MSERPLYHDWASYAFLITGLLLALCVFSYEPVGASRVSNFFGTPGAWCAETLNETLGVGIYALLAGWLALVLLLFLRRGMLTWSLRLAGWLVLIPFACVVADYLGPEVLGGPVSGSGGSLGAWLTDRLQTHFAPIHRWTMLGAVFLLGLFLAADFILIRIARLLGRAVRVGCAGTWLGLKWLIGTSGVAPQAVPASAEVQERQTRASEQTSSGLPSPFMPPPSIASARASEKNTEIPIRHHDHAISTLASAADVKEPEKETPKETPVPIKRLTADPEEDRFADYEVPPLSLLEEPQPFPYAEHDQYLRERAALLEKTFTDFGLNVRVVGINTGPVITQYEVALETGLRVYKVTALADDLALNLKVPSVRIVAPIPGKNTVGIEIPNEHRAVVRLKEVILTAGKKVARSKIPLFLGKDTEGKPLLYDLAEMPHLLIAGRTGTGKSVCMNAIILSILMTRRPDEVKMIMIDPKMLELSEYGKIPHLMHPVVKDMKKAEAILAWAVDKMEERYDLLSRARVRSIAAYNELTPAEIHTRVQAADDEERARIPDRMPYIVIFVDEMNDLMMTMKKEVEGHIIRLAQKSRAAGIHLVVATQKPTVDVITGLIKSNLPARICFQVSSRVDSRVVLDEMGADKLLGKGDMLFLQPGTSTLIRAQGTFASDQEITRVVENLECEPCYVQELVQLSTTGKDGKESLMDTLRARDDLYEQAIEVILREGRGSVSLLQRALGIGYGRAARLIDFMAEDGIVGDYNGSQAREVLYTPDQWRELKENGALT